MSVPDYYLRIDYLAQNSNSGDPEVPVSPDNIDYEKFLHVYLTGSLQNGHIVQLRVAQLPTADVKPDGSREGRPAAGPQSYKATLAHYALSPSASYILRAVDRDGEPWAVASQEIRTR
jgi:hypothetical protein